MACLSKSRWTGMESFPRKRLMIGRLFANLSLTSISRTSVGRETKLNCWNKRRAQINKLVAGPQQYRAERHMLSTKTWGSSEMKDTWSLFSDRLFWNISFLVHLCPSLKRKNSENTIYLDLSPNLVHSTVSQRAQPESKPQHRLLSQIILGKPGTVPSKTAPVTKCIEMCWLLSQLVWS